MGDVLMFPLRTQPTQDVAIRHLSSAECRYLGQADVFDGFTTVLDDWISRHDQLIKKEDRSLQALLEDSWLLYSLASNGESKLTMTSQHRLRWNQLGYGNLSDLELLVVCSNNLCELRDGVNELRFRFPPEVREDMGLYGLAYGMDLLARQIESLWNNPGTEVYPGGEQR